MINSFMTLDERNMAATAPLIPMEAGKSVKE